jgi:stress-induced morphogen
MLLQKKLKNPHRENILRLLKFAMPYFKASNNRSKYANELLRLLVHQLFILSEKEAHMEFDGLFINIQKKEDSYLPTDLQMEYVINDIKKHIKHMHSGQTEKNIEVHSKALSGLKHIADNYDKQANTVIWSTSHKHTQDCTDVLQIVNDLIPLKPFAHIPGRCHSTFSKLTDNLINDIDSAMLHGWLTEKMYVYAEEIGR